MKTVTQVYEVSAMQESKSYNISIDVPIIDKAFDIDNDAKERIFDSIDFAKMSSGMEDCRVYIDGNYIGVYTVNWKLID